MENPLCSRTFASLRVSGRNLDCERVAAWAGVEATEVMQREARDDVWLYSSEDKVRSTDLEVHIAHVISGVARGDEAAALPSGGACDVFCFWESLHGHGGPVLSHGILERLGSAGIALSIDFYCA